uniref:Uncharacterized protein n=1 Tax=Sinocyclocheilus anshuiensis TaxID=1608454 RepID=A0A671NGY6_9TELE
SQDVSGKYKCQRYASLQQFTSHLQEVSDAFNVYVVELMGMVVEFIQNLEVKIKMVQAIPKTDSYLSNLNSAITQLLAQGTEVENLYKQVLKRRGHLHTKIKDMSS